MYCVNCGVQLADSQKRCPLCGTVVFHPELSQPEGERLYPKDTQPAQEMQPLGLLLILTTVFLAPMFITVICDLQITGRISWSGYVVGGLILAYIVFVLPYWFRKPNPTVFVPIFFTAACLFLLYINLETEGHWFLSFALPVTAFFGLLATAIVALLRYIRRGRLYIFAGAFLLTGLFMPLMEFLLTVTFPAIRFIGWCWYPLVGLLLPGITLLILAICRPLRESVRKRSFL